MVLHDKYPEIVVSDSDDISEGYKNIVNDIHKQKDKLNKDKVIITIDFYPGVNTKEIIDNLITPLAPTHTFFSDNMCYSSAYITDMLKYHLTDDRVFGIFSQHQLKDFFDADQLTATQNTLSNIEQGLIIVYGVGARLVCEPDILIYADLSRWEIQQRFQANMPNWLANNQDEDVLRKIKRAYFIEWPVADKHKKDMFDQVDFWLDTNLKNNPKMADRNCYLNGLKQVISQPFRLVPYFASGVWGGQWMREKFALDQNEPNFAWSFNGVPAENSIYLTYGQVSMEIPANNVVFRHPVALLGNKVYGRFGTSFPIRFNFLDTVEGQNLSLQVHPTVDYVQETFGAPYTQDESYYVMHAEEDASVYLGVKEGIDPSEMKADLKEAEKGGAPFADEKYVNQFPAKKHDHFSIPGGTIHSQGKNSVVLEISSTPNIYTFKLWDWGRVDLDGKPRPVHLEHGINNIQWFRDTDWVKENLINPVKEIDKGKGWLEEKTGLYETEFIETRRHWFSEKVYHKTHGSVNVFNLVEGDEAIIESMNNEFKPFIVHYAETFIIPEHIKEYTIRPYGRSAGKEIATIKAYVRV